MEEAIDPTYACSFDRSSPNWQRSAEYSRIYIEAQRNYANHKLYVRGFIFLNEVLDSLGLQLISKGQLIGWVEGGMGYISYELEMFEDHIQLTFTTDGEIWQHLDSMYQ